MTKKAIEEVRKEKAKKQVQALIKIAKIVGPVLDKKEKILKDKIEKYYGKTENKEACSGY